MIYGVFGLVFVCWFLWISRGTNDADPNTLSYRLNRAWRRLAFWAGDVRFSWQWYLGFLPLPQFSWEQHDYAVSPEDLLAACKLLKAGDVMLATKHGFIFSNSAIPGVFKHAAVVVSESSCSEIVVNVDPESPAKVVTEQICDPSEVKLVEAVSEGVMQWHPLRARADLMIFLRPKGVSDADRMRAAVMASKLVGCQYDANFDFNIEAEMAYLEQNKTRDIGAADDMVELDRISRNFSAEYDLAFSCTEVAAAAWWFKRRALGIARKRVRGRNCIVADQFVSRSFKVVWTNVSEETAKKMGLHEEGLREITAYWEGKHVRKQQDVQEPEALDASGGEQGG